MFVKVFRRKWYNERREGPFEVVRSTGTAVQVKGSPTWYHLSHCVKAPSEEASHLQSQDVECSRKQKTKGKNIHQTGRYMKIPRVRTQKETLSMLWTMLMILCTFLMMPEMTLQLMDRKEDLVTLSFNMSQIQQDLFQLPAKYQRYQRAVAPLQDNSGIQLNKGAQDQLGKGLNQTVTRTRVEVTLGKSAQLPCQCTGNNSGEGELRVEWTDSHGRVLVLSGILPLRKYTLINDKRRLKVEGDCGLHIYRPQQEDQGDYRCSFYDPRFGNERS